MNGICSSSILHTINQGVDLNITNTTYFGGLMHSGHMKHGGRVKHNGRVEHIGHGMEARATARSYEAFPSELLAPSSASPAPRPVDSGVGTGRFPSFVGTSVMSAIGSRGMVKSS